ncbi:MAG: phosphatase PAP2 family protein [Myxococcales bacterium]|nr:phosphatase PAP2 family protein [Myxococcales bacterium]MCB9548238.1 phosphatase PAP2 family protein [Myxococcales bacterium]
MRWCCGVACALALAGPARAEVGFTLDPVTDTTLLGAAVGFVLLSEAVLRTDELGPQLPTDRDRLLAIDRWATQGDYARDFADRDGQAWLSWGTAGGLLLWGAVDSLALQTEPTPWTDLGLYAESAFFALTFTQLAKAGFRRPRPYTYLDGAPLETASDSALSFFSGHTAAAFALAGTSSYFAVTRQDSDLVKAGVIVGTGSLAFLTAWLRVTSRKHFVTDVLAGALVGTATGVLVPHLHRDDGKARVDAAPAMLRLGGGF